MRKRATKKTVDMSKRLADRVVEAQTSSTKHITRYLTKRSGRMVGVRRFAATWIILTLCVVIATLAAFRSAYRMGHPLSPVRGGTYIEGVVGQTTNLNPLFSIGNVDASVNKLVFNGLFTYNNEGELIPDLAKSWTVDKKGTTYTIVLRNDVVWHDGAPFNSEDVVYTIGAMQDEQTRSPLYASWRGIKVTALDEHRVSFKLSAPLAPFLNALTTPILPEHALGEVPLNLLRTADFNTAPIGTGPFKVDSHAKDGGVDQVVLSAHTGYFRGAPQLDKFIVRGYEEEDQLRADLKNKEITAAVDLNTSSLADLDKGSKIKIEEFPVRNGVFVFFKTTTKRLSDTKLRQALALATDRTAILKVFDARYQPLKTPLLSGQLGYDASASQETNLKSAKKLVQQAGWKRNSEGQLAKKGAPLQLRLITLDTPEYSTVATEIQRQWAQLGVTIVIELLDQEQLKQQAVGGHDYDLLLYGISIGDDPDIYAYWHSSQAYPGGLNFSEWRSGVADISLDIARSRLNPTLRTARYEAFQKEWNKQAPAVALYQPRMSYAYYANVAGVEVLPLNSYADRLTNVQEWTVNTRRVRHTP